MLLYDDAYSLASLYHTNSEPWANEAAYADPHARVMEFKTAGAREDSITLPPAPPSTLAELIRKRQSCRDFAALPIAPGELAAVLESGYGVTGLREWSGGQKTFTRAVPSAGARYPLELYVLCNRVEGIPAGLYHSHARDRLLEPVHLPYTIADLVPDLMRQDYLEPAAALVLITGVFSRTLSKYGPRGYRYMLMECGHVAQNICLRAAEMGLTSLCVGGFSDQRVNELLQLERGSEATLYGVAVGKSVSGG